MECPKCKSNNIRLAPPMQNKGAVRSYKDADGKQHVHDTKSTVVNARCKCGHSWAEVTISSPCWCGFGKKL